MAAWDDVQGEGNRHSMSRSGKDSRNASASFRDRLRSRSAARGGKILPVRRGHDGWREGRAKLLQWRWVWGSCLCNTDVLSSQYVR